VEAPALTERDLRINVCRGGRCERPRQAKIVWVSPNLQKSASLDDIRGQRILCIPWAANIVVTGQAVLGLLGRRGCGAAIATNVAQDSNRSEKREECYNAEEDAGHRAPPSALGTSRTLSMPKFHPNHRSEPQPSELTNYHSAAHHVLERFANEQPARIGALLAALSVDPSRSRTSRAFRPIANAKGAYRGSEAPFIVNPLNASFVA